MNDRFFTDSIQYQAVLLNLEKNNGQLRCALCGKNLTSKSDCHFDHIIAYAKGGKSTLDNCQILCIDCNLTKSDKDMRDFILEEKAKLFMSGEPINCDYNKSQYHSQSKNCKISKEEFDSIIRDFIGKHGSIRKVDFTRDKNGLPSITYVTKFYGSINDLKYAFGLKPDTVWNRQNIWERLVEYSKYNPEFKQNDLTKSNELPSLPCILSYFPEYKNFNDIKIALDLEPNYELWSKEKVFDACKLYLKNHSKILLKDLKKENGLPTSKVIYKYFGSMQQFQLEIGSEISKKQEYISKDELIKAVRMLINQRGSIFESRSDFLEAFPYSQSVILNRYGSFDDFIKDAKISIIKNKKAKYTKQEVDTIILEYLKSGNSIPSSAKQLSGLNLPSSSTILRFYDDWKEPFVLFLKMINITNK